MKNSRNEKFSEHLLNVDEEILTNAYEIDDAEKLRQYIKAKNAKTKKPFYMTPMFRRVAAIAACFVLIVGVMFSIPGLLSHDKNRDPQNNHHGEVVPPWLKGEESYLTINSIDMLNYYSAIRVLEDPTEVKTMSAKADAKIMLLSANTRTTSNMGIVLLSNTNDHGVGYDEPIEGSKPITPSNPQTIVYYELERDAVFTVSNVFFFQIELTDAKGFLASKVGTGTVDVVITKNDMEDLITFRNGDRFYSCCANGGGWDIGKWEFSTHKYVEDFCLVKNLEQDNYQFVIEFDRLGNATGIKCEPYKTGGPHADMNMSVVSSTHIASTNARFTIADLEEYFNTGKFPEGTEDPSQTEKPPVVPPPTETADFYTNGQYIFELKSDNTFAYYSVDENSAVYRKGSYSWGCDAIEFRFTHEGEVVETVSCDLTGPISFTYNGSEYAKEPTGGEQS